MKPASNSPSLNKVLIRKRSFQWHLILAWVAAFALLCFTVSAITHPILTWTGPQSSAFRAPQALINANHVNNVPAILAKHKISQALVAKLVPSERGVLLQVTENAKQARRYFDPVSGLELANYDQQHAIWLARYYALGGDESIAVRDVVFQTEFDHAYPWVNRLLPVYKITFESDQNLSAFIYTEINALGSISNDYKTRLQRVFQTLHTWSWLDGFEYARLIIMVCLLLSLFAMTLTGLALIFSLKRRPGMSNKGRWHRTFANIVCLPILAFCISGFWHLLHNRQTSEQAQYDTQISGLQMGAPINLQTLHIKTPDLVKDLPSTALNQLSVIEHQGDLFYRMSLPVKRGEQSPPAVDPEHAHHEKPTRNARFDGQKSESGGRYYSVSNGQAVQLNDKDVAFEIALKHLGLQKNKLINSNLVTHFGPNYDFRNKRLPVWQFDFNTSNGDTVFVDPVTGVIVDSLTNSDRYEGYSFSFLHKWSFLTPFIGRQWRDALVVMILLLCMTMTGLGVAMRYKRKK